MLVETHAHGRPVMSTALVLFPGFALTTVAQLTQVFNEAANESAWCNDFAIAWEIASACYELPATSCGLKVPPTIGLEKILECDVLVVCIGHSMECSSIRSEVWDLLRRARRESKIIVGICAGSIDLARTILLDGNEHDLMICPSRVCCDTGAHPPPRVRSEINNEGKVVLCNADRLCFSTAAHLIRLWQSPKPLYALSTSQLGLEGSLQRSIAMWRTDADLARASKMTKRSIELMEHFVGEPFPVAELANRLATTRTKLNRLFKRDMGVAPGEYWLLMRLKIARLLLVDGGHTVTEVAYELGFSDAAHFCRQFKDKFGQTPSVYRRALPVR